MGGAPPVVVGRLISWERFERAYLLHTSRDCLGLLFPRVTAENMLLSFRLCPERMVSLLFLLVGLILVVALSFGFWVLVRGLFILFGCSFILRQGDFINVVSAVVGSNFVIFALFHQIFYGSLTLDSYGDLSPKGTQSMILCQGSRSEKSVKRRHLKYASLCSLLDFKFCSVT